MILELSFGAVHVWRAALKDFTAKINSFWQILSQDEKNRAQRFIATKARENFILAHGILRKILASYLDVPAETLIFEQNAFGKPSLARSAIHKYDTNLQFNLSHSGDLALFAFTLEKAVGIDIEAIKTKENYLAIAKRFFSLEEIKVLEKLAEKDRKRAFFHCWARKEAFIKALGKGLSYPLDKFSVSVDPLEPNWTLQSSELPEEQVWSLFTLNPSPNYAAALAVKGTVQDLQGWHFGQ